MNKSIINIKNESRAALIAYLDAKAEKKTADAKERTTKAAAKNIFADLGKEYKAQNCTEYLVGYIQKSNAIEPVIYKETTKRGAIDWEAYAKSLGGTDVGAEDFRKDEVKSVSIDWATDKQKKELGL